MYCWLLYVFDCFREVTFLVWLLMGWLCLCVCVNLLWLKLAFCWYFTDSWVLLFLIVVLFDFVLVIYALLCFGTHCDYCVNFTWFNFVVWDFV